jgi:hypothetical protein
LNPQGILAKSMKHDDNKDMISKKSRIFRVSPNDVALVPELLKLTRSRLATVAKSGLEFAKMKV